MREISVEYVPRVSLAPAPYNPRKMSEQQFTRLKRGIERFGMVDPIVARRSDRLVIGGHQRLRAAEELGLITVPVVFLDGVSDHEAAALNTLLNNKEAQGEWDMASLSSLLSELDGAGFDATLTGFDQSELEKILTWTPSVVPDAEAFGALPSGEKSPFEQMKFTLTKDQADMVREAMDLAKQLAKASGGFHDTGNANSNGNALGMLAEFALSAMRASTGEVVDDVDEDDDDEDEREAWQEGGDDLVA